MIVVADSGPLHYLIRQRPYCAALGIQPPRIEDASSSPDANYDPIPRAEVQLARLLDASQGTE